MSEFLKIYPFELLSVIFSVFRPFVCSQTKTFFEKWTLPIHCLYDYQASCAKLEKLLESLSTYMCYRSVPYYETGS